MIFEIFPNNIKKGDYKQCKDGCNALYIKIYTTIWEKCYCLECWKDISDHKCIKCDQDLNVMRTHIIQHDETKYEICNTCHSIEN